MAEIQKKNNTPEQSGFPGRRQLGQGCRIGEYSIVKKLSENVEGFVYLAQDSILGDMVQIKEFFPEEMAVRGNLPENGEELSGSDALQPLEGCAAKFKYFRACFQDLYSTLRQERDNECLLPILQIVEQNATVYVVSEYRALQTLEQHLQQVGGKESWCRAKQYLLPLYNSLSNLHKAGIIHQCISPDNILLDDEGNPAGLLPLRDAHRGEPAAGLRLRRSGAVPAGRMERGLDRCLLHRRSNLPGTDRHHPAGRASPPAEGHPVPCPAAGREH